MELGQKKKNGPMNDIASKKYNIYQVGHFRNKDR